MRKEELAARSDEQLKLLQSLEARLATLASNVDAGDTSTVDAELDDIVAKLEQHSAETRAMLEERRRTEPMFAYNYDIAKSRLDAADKELARIKKMIELVHVMLKLKPKEKHDGIEPEDRS